MKTKNNFKNFVATVSHHLSQPLTSIVGCSDWLLKHGYLSRTDRLTVEKIVQESMRMGAMLRQIENLDAKKAVPYLGSVEMYELDSSEKKSKRHGNALVAFASVDWANISDAIILKTQVVRLGKRLFPKDELKLWLYDEEKDFFHELGKGTRALRNSAALMDVLQSTGIRILRKPRSRVLLPVPGTRYRHGVLELRRKAKTTPTSDMLATLKLFSHFVGLALSRIRLHRESVHLRNYLVQIFDNATVMFLTLNESGRAVVFNRAVDRALGYSGRELAETPFYELGETAEDQQKLQEALETAKSSQLREPLVVRLRTKRGQSVQLRMHCSAISEATGEPEKMLAIAENLSQIRSLEDQVIQADKLAMLGQMAAGVAHELNNPVTILSVYTEDFLKKAKSEGQPEVAIQRLDNMVGAANRIRNLANSLLSLAKPIQNSKSEYFDLNRVIQESIAFTAYELKNPQLRLETDFSDDLPRAIGAPSQIQQVFINLLINAAAAFGEGNGRIAVKTEMLDEDFLQAVVSDNGKGIEKAFVNKIFEPFFTTKGAGGTGLGLSVVKRIIDQVGGGIKVESRPGEGTTFFLRFRKAPNR